MRFLHRDPLVPWASQKLGWSFCDLRIGIMTVFQMYSQLIDPGHDLGEKDLFSWVISQGGGQPRASTHSNCDRMHPPFPEGDLFPPQSTPCASRTYFTSEVLRAIL